MTEFLCCRVWFQRQGDRGGRWWTVCISKLGFFARGHCLGEGGQSFDTMPNPRPDGPAGVCRCGGRPSFDSPHRPRHGGEGSLLRINCPSISFNRRFRITSESGTLFPVGYAKIWITCLECLSPSASAHLFVPTAASPLAPQAHGLCGRHVERGKLGPTGVTDQYPQSL